MLATGGSGAADSNATPRGMASASSGRIGTPRRSRHSACRCFRAVCATASRARPGWGPTPASPPSTAATPGRHPPSSMVACSARCDLVQGGGMPRDRPSAHRSLATVPDPRALRPRGASRGPSRGAAQHERGRARRVAVLLTSFPTRHARRRHGRWARYPRQRLAAARRSSLPMGCESNTAFSDGDELMHALIGAGGHDPEFLTDDQLATSSLRMPVTGYLEWYATLPVELRRAIEQTLGPAARRSLSSTARTSSSPAWSSGNVLVAIQPPPRLRGGSGRHLSRPPTCRPRTTTPRLLPLARPSAWGADAIVHLGKQRDARVASGQDARAGRPDARLMPRSRRTSPLVYPFIVNDPGRGRSGQAPSTRP